MRLTIIAALAALAACAPPPANQVTEANASDATVAASPVGPSDPGNQNAADETRSTTNTAASPPAGNAVNRQEIGVECDAEPATFALDQPYSAALAERARAASGARTVRRLEPGQIVTMEYLGSRLNLETDAQNRVSGVRCG